MRGVGEAKHTTRGDPVASKTKAIFGPLSETDGRPGAHPQIWKRIHIQKPSGVHTKFFWLGDKRWPPVSSRK
jgi:hypothetical protein